MLRGTLLFELFALTKYWANTLGSSRDPSQLVEKFPYGEHPKQYMMLYSPQQIDKSKPIILYYHGGGWIFGRPELFHKKASLFTQHGYQVIMPCYRKLPQHTGREILNDVIVSTAYLHELKNAGKIFNLDKIILGGVSAGANLVSLLYLNPQMHESSGFTQKTFVGMFLYAPPLDLSKMSKTPILFRYTGKPKDSLYIETNPINFIENNLPIPILCRHGNKDALVNIKASQSFRNIYEKQHPGLLQFNLIDNGSHLDSASWAHQDNDIRKELLAWLDQFT